MLRITLKSIVLAGREVILGVLGAHLLGGVTMLVAKSVSMAFKKGW